MTLTRTLLLISFASFLRLDISSRGDVQWQTSGGIDRIPLSTLLQSTDMSRCLVALAHLSSISETSPRTRGRSSNGFT